MPHSYRRFATGLLAVCGLFAFSPAASATIYSLEANFDGLQEVPPNASPAFGFGAITLDSVAGTFSITTGTYQDLLGGANAVSLNDAAVGVNGPLITALTLDTPGAASGTYSGSGALTLAEVTDMINGNTYINIRSAVFPSGEIRGQLFVVPEPVSLAFLSAGAMSLLLRRRKVGV